MTDRQTRPPAQDADETLHASRNDSDSFLAELGDLMRQNFFNIDTPTARVRTHSYSPILGEGSIRLLMLESGLKNEPLRGSLSQVSLDSLPPYEALSYCWGSPDKPYSILLDAGSTEMTITASLHSALVRLRRRFTSRSIWADAICINQADNAEKVQQILLMQQIYSRAFRTVAYLGDEADGSDAALELHEKIAKIDFSALPEKYVTTEWLKAHGLPRLQDSAWLAWQTFWRRPWFRRAWVLQEFILGQDVTLICGRKKIGWKKFVSATEKMQDFNLMKLSVTAQDTFDSIDEARGGASSMFAM